MATLSRDADGRPIILGSGGLPPMDEPPDTSTNSTTGKATTREKAKQAATRDRFKTLNAFVDFTMKDLTPSESLVWFVIYREIRDGVATVAQSDIARRTGLTQGTVSLAVRRLTKRGLVRIVHQGGFRKGLSSYRVRGSV